MKKKFLSMLLVLSLCLGLLAACGASQSAEEISAASGGETVEVSTPVSEDTAPAPIEASERESETAAVPEETAITLPLTTEPAEVTVWYAGSPNQMPYLEDGTYTNTAANKAVSEATGIDIEFTTVSNESAVDSFNLMIASNDLPDIILWN